MQVKVACSACGNPLKIIEVFKDMGDMDEDFIRFLVTPCPVCAWNTALEHYEKQKELLRAAKEAQIPE